MCESDQIGRINPNDDRLRLPEPAYLPLHFGGSSGAFLKKRGAKPRALATDSIGEAVQMGSVNPSPAAVGSNVFSNAPISFPSPRQSQEPARPHGGATDSGVLHAS